MINLAHVFVHGYLVLWQPALLCPSAEMLMTFYVINYT
jgi:hypothetical protein